MFVAGLSVFVAGLLTGNGRGGGWGNRRASLPASLAPTPPLSPRSLDPINESPSPGHIKREVRDNPKWYRNMSMTDQTLAGSSIMKRVPLGVLSLTRMNPL